jgi:hypothetical protein
LSTRNHLPQHTTRRTEGKRDALKTIKREAPSEAKQSSSGKYKIAALAEKRSQPVLRGKPTQ